MCSNNGKQPQTYYSCDSLLVIANGVLGGNTVTVTYFAVLLSWQFVRKSKQNRRRIIYGRIRISFTPEDKLGLKAAVLQSVLHWPVLTTFSYRVICHSLSSSNRAFRCVDSS